MTGNVSKNPFKPDSPLDSPFEYLPIYHVFYGSQVVSERLVSVVEYTLPKVRLAVLCAALKFCSACPCEQRQVYAPVGSEYDVIDRTRDPEPINVTEHEVERVTDALNERRVLSCRGYVHCDNTVIGKPLFHLAEKLLRCQVKRDVNLLRVGVD